MKILAWGAVVVSVGVVALTACGGGSGTGGGGAGTGGESTTTGSTTTTSTSTTSSSTTTVTSGSTTSTSSTITMPPGCGSVEWSSDPACEACVEANCCAEEKACDSGTDCGALLDCLNACAANDQPCIDGCLQGGAAPGLSDAQALSNCYDNSCGMDPACASGAICDSGLTVMDPVCGMCLGTNCCQEFTDCVNDSAVPSCLDCITGATMDPACANNPAVAAANGCYTGMCAAECGAAPGICDSGLTTNDVACDTCLGTKCCTEIDACSFDTNTPACLDACILAATPDPMCQVAGTALGDLYLPVKTCWNGMCSGANDCGNMLP